MISAVPYDCGSRGEWNAFVAGAKNGTFLFHRDYMDYHADRFRDASLMFRDGAGTLVAVMPSSVSGETMTSHAGLTYGGVVCDRRMRTAPMLHLFDALRAHMRARGVARLLYKRIPHIYHDVPSDEDLYALFRNGALLARRDVSSAVLMADRLPYAKGRKWSLGKSRKHELAVGPSGAIEEFMALEAAHLEAKFGVRPAHTGAEMRLLATRFPENIRLFTASRGGRMLAGVVLYESRNVAHAQYIGTTEEGRELGALDAIVDLLLGAVCKEKRYFDFGTSNEDEGRRLNEPLIENKESYGARAVAHDHYELTA